MLAPGYLILVPSGHQSLPDGISAEGILVSEFPCEAVAGNNPASGCPARCLQGRHRIWTSGRLVGKSETGAEGSNPDILCGLPSSPPKGFINRCNVRSPAWPNGGCPMVMRQTRGLHQICIDEKCVGEEFAPFLQRRADGPPDLREWRRKR